MYKDLTGQALLRICREVATERDLFSCMGTFYELPAENADGYAKIRPISTHHYRINDYASYRGMLLMTGIKAVTILMSLFRMMGKRLFGQASLTIYGH
jgi:hypothetical protein